MPSLHGHQVNVLLSTTTEEMLGAAERGEWETVETLEKHRLAILHAHEAEFDPETVSRVLKWNDRILELGESEKSRLAEKVSSLQVGKRARNAYEI
ncbi:flagellar protein FliT [Gammaproteobacteria bacterium]